MLKRLIVRGENYECVLITFTDYVYQDGFTNLYYEDCKICIISEEIIYNEEKGNYYIKTT